MTACLNHRSLAYALTGFAYPAGGSVNRRNCVVGVAAAGYAFFFRSFRARAGQFDTAHLACVASSGGMASLRMIG